MVLILSILLQKEIIKKNNPQNTRQKENYKLNEFQKENRKYYVYRFLNKDNIIIYVGRTSDLSRRLSNHEHITDNVSKIEYIECDSEAEMAWKEIYYINLYYNQLSENKTDVYTGGKIKDIGLNDYWKSFIGFKDDICRITSANEKYEKYIIDAPKYDYKSLIHILDNPKMNQTGTDRYSLSRNWFYDHQYDGLLKSLKNNTVNFFRNICHDKSSQNLWTTYDEFGEIMKGNGYTKGFISLSRDYFEQYKDRIYLAYLANNFYPAKKSVSEISEDQFALSELLQFIFNSAIREGNEIWVYIPSIRMRRLLKLWIEKNSPTIP